MITHLPRVPDFRCSACLRAWPCETAASELGAAESRTAAGYVRDILEVAVDLLGLVEYRALVQRVTRVVPGWCVDVVPVQRGRRGWPPVGARHRWAGAGSRAWVERARDTAE